MLTCNKNTYISHLRKTTMTKKVATVIKKEEEGRKRAGRMVVGGDRGGGVWVDDLGVGGG